MQRTTLTTGKLSVKKTRQQPNGSGKQQRNDLNNGFAVVSVERAAPYNPKRDEPKKKACHPVKEVSRVCHFLSQNAYFWQPTPPTHILFAGGVPWACTIVMR